MLRPSADMKAAIPAIDGLMQRAKQAGIYCEMSPAFCEDTWLLASGN
jgi:hypothetical protein